MSTLRHGIPGGHTGPAPAIKRILPAQPASVPEARQLVATTLREWGVSEAGSDCAQVVAELAANAVRESQRRCDGEILLRVTCRPQAIVLEVGDRNPLPPPRPPRTVAGDQEHGRGLPIARALSRRLAWYSQDGWKIVWAVIPIPVTRRQSGRQGLGAAA